MTTTLPKNIATLQTNTNSTSRINIRYAPNGSDIKTDRPQGTPVCVIAESTLDVNRYKWYKVVYYTDRGDDIGWVREDVINILSKDWQAALEPQKPEVLASEENTYLFFTTLEKAVRVFGTREELYLNVYDQVSEETQLRSTRAIRLPDRVSAPEGSKTLWQSYIAEQSGRVYIARFVPLQQVELIISAANTGEVIYQEPGFSSRGMAYQMAYQ